MLIFLYELRHGVAIFVFLTGRLFLADGKTQGEGIMMSQRDTQDQIFNKTIASLRKAMHGIEDFSISVMLAAVIASITKNKTDINFAVDRASGHGNADARAEALFIIVKALAKARHFPEARSVVCEMTGLTAYWKAEAYIWIARFSGEPNDIEAAKSAVSNVNAPYLRNELRVDMESLLHQHPHYIMAKPQSHKHLPDLKALQAVLSELKGLEDSHRVTPKFTSAYLRFKAHEIIIRLFADATKL